MVNVPIFISSGGRLRLFALIHTVDVTQIHSTALTASLPLTDETQVSPGGVWVNIYTEAVTPRAAAGSSTRKEISESEAAEPADNKRYDGVQVKGKPSL